MQLTCRIDRISRTYHFTRRNTNEFRKDQSHNEMINTQDDEESAKLHRSDELLSKVHQELLKE